MTPLQCLGAVDRARAILESDEPSEREDGLDRALAEIVLAMFAPAELAELMGEEAPPGLDQVATSEVLIVHRLWEQLSLPQRYRFFSLLLAQASSIRLLARSAGIIP
jgi:hypothetical protein